MTAEYWIKINTDCTPTIIAEGGEDAIGLKEMQGAVGGLIEYCTFGRNVQLPVPHPKEGRMVMATVIDCIAHEEGRLVAEPKVNPIGTYAAFGQSITEAPYAIVGDVLVHVRIADDAPSATPMQLVELIMGDNIVRSPTDSHMMPHMGADEADYGVEEE